MSGDSPKQIISMTLTRTQFILTLAVTVLTILGFAWTTTSLAYGWMEKTAQDNYEHRVIEDLSPPDGTIYIEVDQMIRSHEHQVEGKIRIEFENLNLRMSRMEILMAEVYEATTGRKVP